jgi:tetratricopeptide (TPR) repeat protein
MGATAIDLRASFSHCAKCGSRLQAIDRFCVKCGASVVCAQPVSRVPAVRPGAINPKEQEFERHLKVAWSCLKDVENKADEIRQAKDAADKEVNEGTFSGTMAMTALQGRLEREFQESLDLAWRSALRASEINANGFIEVEGIAATPSLVFSGVCGLRGDLKFAMDRWDEAVGLYNLALQYTPGEPTYYFNIGAAYTNKHDPAHAIEAFQKVIELDPVGEYGIGAAKNLDKLRIGSIGRKGFAGSWKVAAILSVLTLLSFFMVAAPGGVGVVSLVLFGGSLTLYCWRKYK